MTPSEKNKEEKKPISAVDEHESVEVPQGLSEQLEKLKNMQV